MAHAGGLIRGDSYESGVGSDDLYTELWKACAGPLVDVPCNRERVYYFPQGHMEQLEASTNQELNLQIPRFNLPSKILCRVVHIQLLAEQETDEVYAQITLLPEPDQTEPTSLDPSPPDPPKQNVQSFCKILTASDTSTHGGFSVLRKHANECLPPLCILSVKISITILNDRGDNGELRVGVRRLSRQQSSMPASVISSQSMHLGVLATASHAITTQTLFVVYYKPRTSQFIIGLNKYLEAMQHGFSVGMRFKMRFEGEDSPERRFTGTIVGVGDFSSQWTKSAWRSLKVQWDEPASILRPDRVSPWEIEPFVPSASADVSQPALKIKRPIPNFNVENTAACAASPLRYPKSTTSLELSHLTSTNDVQSSENQVFWPPKQKEINVWSHVNALSLFRESTEDNKNVTIRSALLDYLSPVSSKATNCLDQVQGIKTFENASACRLFGIDLRNNSNNIPQRKHVQIEVSPNDMQGKQSFASSSRTRIKVQMQGIAVGRGVDLTAFNGYDELITELENMFEIKGELHPRNKWEVVYTDNEGDIMLVGDDPWPEEVKKMGPRCKLPLSSLDGEGTILSLESEPKSEA
ncbi:hypothetical protein DH2020_006212 [Rehmannia glutinosa]|uniref:Auxin-responsive protein n=1 Tax=Rehmannia glutinosa TaxID=99300 RepID=A0ABR0XI77_REHGL